MLVASVGSGQLITKFGQWKPFIVAGAVLLLVGFGLLSTIDHATSLWTIGIFIAIVGLGTGMLMQNIVLAVQNTVSVENNRRGQQYRGVLPHLRRRDRRVGARFDSCDPRQDTDSRFGLHLAARAAGSSWQEPPGRPRPEQYA